VAHHAVGRIDVEVLADLANRWAVTPGVDFVADEIEDLALAGSELIE
jgi:hypothetical protein